MEENYETKLLGTLILNPDQIAVTLETIRPEHFARKFHRQLFSALLVCYEKNTPIEIVSIKEKLGEESHEELLSLADGAGVPSNIPFYAEKVREWYLRDQLMIDCAWAREEAARGEPLDELLDGIEEKIFSLSERKVSRTAVKLEDIIPSAYTRIMDGKKSAGLLTGFYDLDKLSGGFAPGDNIVIAGRPSMGKSAFVVSCMIHWAKQDIPSAILTLETTKEQVVNRILSAHSRIQLQRIRMGMLSNEEKEGLADLCNEVEKWPIYIDDSFSVTTLELKAKARRLVSQFHPRVLAIDYLQLISGGRRFTSRNEEVAEISHTIQGLAKELEIPILSVSQLSRQTERREDKRPGLADLRDSGSIEQDATSVIFIYRPEMYKIKIMDGKSMEGLAFVEIAKQKDGPTGEFKLTFLKDYALFENHAEPI